MHGSVSDPSFCENEVNENNNICFIEWASLIAPSVKYLPATQETWVPIVSQEDPLEREMTTHSSILAWRIPWTMEPGRL